MASFRKKPVVIEAEQTARSAVIHTLEGDMTAEPGDWIITGVKGERYPCKPDIFEATYEPVSDEGKAVIDEQCAKCGVPMALFGTHTEGSSLCDIIADLRSRSAERHEEVHHQMLQRRDVEVPCAKCHGWGVRTYGDTSTWRGGMGGQMMTSDVCDECWGSGDAKRPWSSRRESAKLVETNKRLQTERDGLEDDIVAWKEASGLTVCGDPESVTPAMLEKSRNKDGAEIERLRTAQGNVGGG